MKKKIVILLSAVISLSILGCVIWSNQNYNPPTVETEQLFGGFETIARDASSQVNSVGAWADCNTSLTWAHTISGTHGILLVGLELQTTSGSGDVATGVTYNGVAMTQLLKRKRDDTSLVYHYLYYLVAPDTGTHNIVVSCSARAQFSYGGAASYTGVAQSAPEASTANQTNGAVSVTTLTDNAWLAGLMFDSSGATLTASTNTTQFNSILAWGRMFDTNAPQTPVGSHSMLCTGGDATRQNNLIVSLAPFSTGGTQQKPRRQIIYNPLPIKHEEAFMV